MHTTKRNRGRFYWQHLRPKPDCLDAWRKNITGLLDLVNDEIEHPEYFIGHRLARANGDGIDLTTGNGRVFHFVLIPKLLPIKVGRRINFDDVIAVRALLPRSGRGGIRQ